MITTTLRKLLGVVGFLSKYYYGDRGECSAEEDTTQQWRGVGGGGGGVGGERTLDPPTLVDVFHLQKLGPYF